MFVAGVLERVDHVAADLGGDLVDDGEPRRRYVREAGHLMHGRRDPTGD